MEVAMELSRIMITELGDQQVIFLREKGGARTFPIMIGISEALAIDRRLKGLPTPRPMTHELLASVIERLGGRLTKIVVNDLRDHTFFATLHIEQEGRMMEIDARPSDAIALGVAFDTPIYVAQHVLESVLNSTPSKEDKLDLLRRRMAMLEEAIDEITGRLADQEFVAGASPEMISQHRKQLAELKQEYEAIGNVLKKLG